MDEKQNKEFYKRFDVYEAKLQPSDAVRKEWFSKEISPTAIKAFITELLQTQRKEMAEDIHQAVLLTTDFGSKLRNGGVEESVELGAKIDKLITKYQDKEVK